MKRYLRITRWYLTFIEKDKKNFFEVLAYAVFYLLSLLYGGVIFLRNACYNCKITDVYHSKAKVISIGNISWAGSGKTSFSMWLYKHLSVSLKTAILRRGYGIDEGELLRSQVNNVFEGKNRAKLAENLDLSFDAFILDDGFQHRCLWRNIDIVIMGSREFKRTHNLIPAYFFREPLSSLKRADIIIINYSDEIENLSEVKKRILNIASKSKVYFSHYKVKKFSTRDNNEVFLSELKGKKIAAFCAIGYPQGFFNKIKETGLNPLKQFVYPDHYQLTQEDLDVIAEKMAKEGIKSLLITAKDRHRFEGSNRDFNIFIMEVELVIVEENELKKHIERLLCISS